MTLKQLIKSVTRLILRHVDPGLRGSFDPTVITAQLLEVAQALGPTEAAGRATGRFINEDEDEKNWNQDNPLHRLAVKYKPTKRRHNYIKHYHAHFGPIREDVKRFVEIGVQTPTSLQMWEEYFPNATIYGIDIDEKCLAFTGGRKKVVIGNQRDRAFLGRFIDMTGGGFDIIVDDGEHTGAAILTSFCCLFPVMSSHGIYAVEDLVDLRNVLKFFLTLEQHINYWPKGFPGKDWPYLHAFDDAASWLDRNVVGLHFYRYLCIVNRGFNPEDNPYLRRDRPV